MLPKKDPKNLTVTFRLRIRWTNRLIALIPWLSRISEIRRLIKASAEWHLNGWTTPVPFSVRKAMLLSEARSIGARILVETGTFMGGTPWSLRHDFQQIHTIEVVPSLASLAKERFSRHSSINVIEGDSSVILPEICRNLEAPCLFYLDGHYSGGITGMGSNQCPIIEELRAILRNTRHAFRIVIDDARLFGADPAYPELGLIRQVLSEENSGKSMRIENDAILIE